MSRTMTSATRSPIARGLLSFHHWPKTLQRSEEPDGFGASCATGEAVDVSAAVLDELGSTLLEVSGVGLAEAVLASVAAVELEPAVVDEVPLVPTGCWPELVLVLGCSVVVAPL